MPKFPKPVVGNFCWADANLEDPARGKEFYSELFGWTVQDIEMGGGVYTMFNKGNNTVAGALKLPENAKKM
ncbi:MAG TPA: hypothetical protein VL137_01745, partial [Polyangiaceae bacterium]|nr:hypothetical protein [Polyangiaceae bacterium]